jgi:hypothetical protein
VETTWQGRGYTVRFFVNDWLVQGFNLEALTLFNVSLHLRLEIVLNMVTMFFAVTNPTDNPATVSVEVSSYAGLYYHDLRMSTIDPGFHSTDPSYLGQGYRFSPTIQAVPQVRCILRDAPGVTDISAYWFGPDYRLSDNYQNQVQLTYGEGLLASTFAWSRKIVSPHD